MRLFPATARQRLVVAVTAGALGVGVLTAPLGAWACIWGHEQAKAHHSVRHAQADLDESSRLTRRAYDALSRSKANLRSARHDLRDARAHVSTLHLNVDIKVFKCFFNCLGVAVNVAGIGFILFVR